MRLAVGHQDGQIMIHFGKPVAWLGIPPAEAMELAKLLMQHAHEAQRQEGRTQ